MKKLARFLLPLLLLSLFSGCQQANPPKESDYILPQLGEERKAIIEDSWHRKNYLGDSNNLRFYVVGSTQEGIRYYGSCTHENGDSTMTYDILFVPCSSVSVPTEVTISGHTFRHRTAFALYAFYYVDQADNSFGVFLPLKDTVENEFAVAEGIELISKEALATAVQTHTAYEEIIYGSVLTQLPKKESATYEARVPEIQAQWLMEFGYLPPLYSEVTGTDGLRYYGTFNGYDILFYSADVFGDPVFEAPAEETIGEQTFHNHCAFSLYAYRDRTFYDLADIYTEGKINNNAIATIAEIHNRC